MKKIFPSKKNFFFIENLEKLKNSKFDAVIFSHSVMYFDKLNLLLRKIHDLLDKNGKLFIQIPDIIKNPLNVLMGDQGSIFTVNSMKNICSLTGFKIVNIEKKFLKEKYCLQSLKNIW